MIKAIYEFYKYTVLLYFATNSHRLKSNYIAVEVDLPKDFAKNVYLPYKDLRDTSQKATDNEKAKTSYWLKINKATNDLSQGLESYSREADDKEYSETAQSILDDSKVKNTDDDEITK